MRRNPILNDVFLANAGKHLRAAPDPLTFNRHNMRAHRRQYRHKQGGAGDTMDMASLQKMNAWAQDQILANAQPMSQPLAPVVPTGTIPGQVLNILLNNVGLNTKLVVEVTFTLAQAAAETLTRTPLGLANLFSNVTLTDLNNYQRINCAGWYLYLVNSYRNRGPNGAAYANDAPVQMGSTYNVQNAPAQITGAKTIRVHFEIPIAHHAQDLRGAIWAGVTSAQWRLQLTINPNIVVASTTTDSTLACYKSSSTDLGTVSAMTVQVYQEYLDQLPRSGGNPILPSLSLAYNYMLLTTAPTGLAQGQDFPVPYPNFRTILSTICIFNNGGTLAAGTDLNYLAVQVANMTFLQKWDPFKTQYETRNLVGTDFPVGTYLLDHRKKPIDTNNFGNTALIINPSAAIITGAVLYTGYEMLALQAQAINAGSFPAG